MRALNGRLSAVSSRDAGGAQWHRERRGPVHGECQIHGQRNPPRCPPTRNAAARRALFQWIIAHPQISAMPREAMPPTRIDNQRGAERRAHPSDERRPDRRPPGIRGSISRDALACRNRCASARGRSHSCSSSACQSPWESTGGQTTSTRVIDPADSRRSCRRRTHENRAQYEERGAPPWIRESKLKAMEKPRE